MAEPRRRRWLALVRIGGAGALLALALAKLDFGAVADVLASADGMLVALAVLVLAAGQALSALRWRAATRALGTDAPARWFTKHYFRGCFYNTVLPTGIGGDAVRVLAVRGLAGGRAAVKGVVLDRLGGLVAAVLAAAVLLPLSGYRLPPALAAAAVLVALACTAAMAWRLPADWLALAAAYVAVWTVGVALLAAGLHVPVALVDVPAVIAITAIAMAVPASIGGMGTREAGFVLALAPLAVPANQAVALGVAFGGALMLVGLLGAPVTRVKRPLAAEATA